MILIPTHNKLRDLQTFRHFVRRFERGLGWTERKFKIPVIVTEDSKCWLYDGHHEISASHYCGISVPIDVLNIIRYDYYQLEQINFKVGYVTPFDPRTECRKSFHEYKFDVLKMYKELGEDITAAHIKQVKHLYSEPRVAQTIQDLILQEQTI